MPYHLLFLALSFALIACQPPDPTQPRNSPPEPEPEPVEAELRINEVQCSGDIEFIEVINTGTTDVDLRDWTLSDDDDPDDPSEIADVGTTLLGPGQLTSVEISTFGIGCDDETVFLFDPDGEPVDTAEPPTPSLGASWGRFPDGTGAFAEVVPSPSDPNALFAVDPWLDDPFAEPVTVDLMISEADLAILDDGTWSEADRVFVPATFRITDEFGTGDPISVGVRQKGTTSVQLASTGRPGLKIDFDRYVEGQHFRGFTKLNFNNQSQDPTHVHEQLTYEVFRLVGLPAPRTRSARLLINGDDRGIGVLVEAPDTMHYLRANFDSTFALFEAPPWLDLDTPSNAVEFDLDEGDDGPAARQDLANLMAAIRDAPAATFYASLDDVLDWDAVLKHIAAEVFVGHWDSYTNHTQNNYFVHTDDDGVWRLLPWGVDQTFAGPVNLYGEGGQGRIPIGCVGDPNCLGGYGSVGVLLRGCLGDLQCAEAYEDALLEIGETVAASPYLGAGMRDLADHLAVPNTAHLIDGIDVFLEGRPAQIDRWTACRRDPAACEHCESFTVDARSFIGCMGPANFDTANADCGARDMSLATFDSLDEVKRAHGELVRRQGPVNYWVGIRNMTWVDGMPLDLDYWVTGGGPSCGVAWGLTGEWVDWPCNQSEAYLCAE